MNSYQQLSNKALGVAFIVAPLLMILGAASLLLGIGVSIHGISSWVEGLFLTFAFLLMVPVYLGLCNLLGQRAPRLAIVCAILAPGLGVGMLPANARMTTEGLVRAGYTDLHIFSLNSPGMPILIIYMALGLLIASLLLSIGFLRYGGIPRWCAVLLIVAPIVFVIGQGGDESIAVWRVQVMYSLATVLWFSALAPIGWRLLRGKSEVTVNTAALELT